MISFTSSIMKNVAVFPVFLCSKFTVKSISCIAFRSSDQHEALAAYLNLLQLTYNDF